MDRYDQGSLEPTTPTRIGSGSFATVYASPGRAIVFKVAHLQEHAAQIEDEFHSLQSVYVLCNPGSIFAAPGALACYDPQTQNLLFSPASPQTLNLNTLSPTFIVDEQRK